MYDNFKLLNYSNSLVSPELYARHLSRLFTGNVVDGLLVVPKTGLTVTLPSGNGFIPYGSGATASAREFSLVADFDITLDTADASNPRIDLIVIYVDMAVSLPGGTPTAANLDGPGVVKATFVKGTPNASPVDPTVGAIQTKIGASNPYVIVAAVRVDATVTTIAANKITDRRTLAQVASANLTRTNIAQRGIWWEEIGRTTLTAAGDAMTVSTLPARKYLKVIVSAVATGGNLTVQMQLNGDTGGNYARRVSINGAAETTTPNATLLVNTAGSSLDAYLELEIVNIAGREKPMVGRASYTTAAGTGTPPDRVEIVGKWIGSAVISSLLVINAGTGDFAIGSEVIILGHD